MENADYEKMYWELRAELRIHESHSHSRCLEFVRVHNDRYAAATRIHSETRKFQSTLAEIEKTIW